MSAVLVAAPAQAAPPTIEVSHLNRHLIAAWTLPDGMQPHVVEAARSPETVQDSGASKGYFLDENRVALTFLFNPREPRWTSTETVVPGTYYVHLGVYDPVVCPLPGLGCQLEFSEAVAVEVALAPPRITSATVNGRLVNVAWSLPAGMSADSLDVANSPAVIADGSDFDGLFLPENVVSSRFLGASATSASTPQLEGGTYWVQLVGRDPDACASTETPECYAASAPVQVVVPRNSPLMQSAAFDRAGYFTASWHLPADLYTDFIEVATSPAVYPSGPRAGEFLDENVVHLYVFDPLFDGYRPTTYKSELAIAVHPGNYYAHVGTASCTHSFCDLFPMSDTFRITIPAPQWPPATPGAAPDRTTSISALNVPARQSIRALYVRASMPESGTLTATGTVNVPGAARVFRLSSTSKAAKPGVTVRLRLKASKRVQRAVRKALRRKRRVTARIVVTASDDAYNSKTERRTIRLKR